MAFEKISEDWSLRLDLSVVVWSSDCLDTVEPRFNEPPYNEVVGIANGTLQSGQSYSKMYGKEPQYNEIFVITNAIQKPRPMMTYNIYPDITNKCQHVTKGKCKTNQQEQNPSIPVTWMEQLHG